MTGVADFKNQVPVTTEIVTVPMVSPLITTEPLALITTGRFSPDEFKVPNTNFTSRSLADPLALPPDVATFNEQGLTRTSSPTASFEPAGNVDAVIVKMHEPKVVRPDAVRPPALMANAGVAVALVKASVVGVVVPKSGTPPAKVKGVFTTAAATLVVTAAVVLLVEVLVATGVELPPPPPQAARAAETSTARNNLLALIMNGLY